MQQLSGTYTWHYVDNENKIKGPAGDCQYLVCSEQSTENGSVWHMDLCRWFVKGDEIKIFEPNGKPHYFKVSKDGFYVFTEVGADAPKVYRVLGVRYWTEIELPNVSPDDVLSIV